MPSRLARTIAPLALALTGCGSEPSSDTATTPAAPTSYRERVADCVEQVGFETRDAGNALRVESPAGRLIANIQTFPTTAEAQRFDREVEVPHAYGGEGVAVWLADADKTQQRVVADCLTP